MKSRYIFLALFVLGIISAVVFDASNNSADSHTSGAPAMRTGSPGDGGATCKNCHSGPNPTTQAGMITSNIPAAGYSAGQTYTITATVTRNGHTKFGFEISPQNNAGTQLGTLIVTNTTEMQLVGSGKYITHKTAGVSGTNSRTWIFNWTAPAAGTGNVTFYGAFNITNAQNNSTGDTTVLSTLTVSECIAPAQPGSITGPAVICSNSGTLTYSISPVAGATGYTWTFPSGWTAIGLPTNTVDVSPGTSSGIISVTASNACGTSAASSLTVSIDQLTASGTSTSVNCNGGNNGTATAIPSNGVAPFTYSWSQGGTTATISNLSAGSYSVTITDGAGCTSSATAAVTQPSPIALNASTTDAFCGNANGSASVVATGGTGSYSYSWNTIPVQTGATASNLLPGNYTVTVTDANLCIASANVSVSNVAGPTVNITVLSDVSCNNGNDGQAIAILTGGTPPFTYQWSPSGGTGATATNLHAGSYFVTVTDANGCTSSSGTNITEPVPLSFTTSSVDAGCGQSNGSATINMAGGVGGYTYQWNTVPVQNTSTAINLAAGSYDVTVQDGNGCSIFTTIGVSNTAGPSLVAGTINNISCFGANDGALSVVVASGNGPFSYLWSPSGGTDTLAQNLQPGTYSVTVTDGQGCISVLSATVSEPALLVADAGIDTTICNGVSFTLGHSPVAGGGTQGYTYLWSPSGELSSATDSTPVATPTSTTDFLLVVTDAHGCRDSSNVTVTVNPTPAAPVISLNADTLFSTQGIFYQWFLDGNILNGSTGQYYIPLQNGDYTVEVTNAFGCSSASAAYHYTSASVVSISASLPVLLFPNPAKEKLTVSIEVPLSADAVIQIYNVLGTEIKNVRPANSGLHSSQEVIDVSDLEPAVYFLELRSGGQLFRRKFAKE